MEEHKGLSFENYVQFLRPFFHTLNQGFEHPFKFRLSDEDLENITEGELRSVEGSPLSLEKVYKVLTPTIDLIRFLVSLRQLYLSEKAQESFTFML